MSEGSGITATATNGATCSEEGMVFDGNDDYIYVTPWYLGGEAMTVEVYVKWGAFDSSQCCNSIWEFGNYYIKQ